MSTDAKDARVKEIEAKLARLRGELEESKKRIESWRGDEDMLDAATREGGRANRTQDEINQLEAELRSLQGA